MKPRNKPQPSVNRVYGAMAAVLHVRKGWALEDPCALLEAFATTLTPEDAPIELEEAVTWLVSAFPRHKLAIQDRKASLQRQQQETCEAAMRAIETYMARWTMKGEDAARFLRLYPWPGYAADLRAALDALTFEDDPPDELASALSCFASEHHERILRRPDLREWQALLPAAD